MDELHLNSDIEKRLEKLSVDYSRVTGKSFNHFFCPILLSDEDVELCKGHIIPECLGNSNHWLPQRKDLDNFFGTMLEADLPGIFLERNIDPVLKLLDKNLCSRHKPKLEYEGKNIDFFLSSQNSDKFKSSIKFEVNDSSFLSHAILKNPPDSLFNQDKATINIVIEKDYVPIVIGSLIKSAHLTLFNMFGYEYIYSPSGYYFASILRDFYFSFKDKGRKNSSSDLGSFFYKYIGMFYPILNPDPIAVKGTLFDNKLFACVGSSEAIFSIGVIVPFAKEFFIVFTPNDNYSSISTYMNFVSDPPRGFSASIYKFIKDQSNTGHFETDGSKIRFESAPKETQDAYYNDL